ncbi:MAG: glycosyltransferase [Raineya sp.]|nr:glycosyltransferase [Raineya sp.]MDW8297536.1 glycosyltransferase [Raineya sp.]
MSYKAAFVAVLKPADDIRLFHKIALTFAEQGFEIHSIGYQSDLSRQKVENNIYLYPVFNFSRKDFKRLWAGWVILKYLCKIKPQVIVCGAVEILLFCVLYKFFQRLQGNKLHLIYDVQENYFLNVLYTQTYQRLSFFRYVLAYAIRWIEKICALAVDSFFLAEKCYEQELSFVRKSGLVLENKCLKPNTAKIESKNVVFLLSGTLAPEYGLWKAIDFAKNMYQKNPEIILKIVGKCSRKNVFEQLLKLKSQYSFLQMEVSTSPVSYEILEQNFAKSTCWLMPYELNKAYRNRIPTKFYEAMAWQKWIIVQKNPAWENFFKEFKYPKVIWVDFEKPQIWQEIDFTKFSSESNYQNSEIFWDTEKEKLIHYLLKLKTKLKNQYQM